eukprot:m51a1_g1723 hypothetical protein (1107) ;mRNA; r:103041-107400
MSGRKTKTSAGAGGGAPPQPSATVRRAQPEDAEAVEAILAPTRSSFDARYGTIDISFAMETSSLALVAEVAGRVVAFAAFGEAAPSWALRSGPAVRAGELWVWAFAADALKERDIARDMMRGAFIACPDVSKNVNISTEASISAVLTLQASRKSFCPRLHIRPARVEDHDDLVPIFDTQSELDPRVHEQFFLARVIQAQSDDDRAFVAEADGRAVGMLCVSGSVRHSDVFREFDSFYAYTGEPDCKGPSLPPTPAPAPPTAQQQRPPTTQAQATAAAGMPAEAVAPIAAAAEAAQTVDSAQEKREAVPSESLTPQSPDRPKTDTGEDNDKKLSRGLCVTLFCLADEYAHRARDFIIPVFDSFPERDYLLLTQPPSAPVTSLLQLFTQLPANPDSTFPHVAYVLTKCSFMGDFYVKKAVAADVVAAKSVFRQGLFVPPISGDGSRARSRTGRPATSSGTPAAMFSAFSRAADSPNKRISYVARSGDKTIGAAVVEKLEATQIQWLWEHYDTDSHLGVLPVQPKHKKVCVVPTSQFFSLFIATSKLLREPKRFINDRVVVVGGSSCGISVLETLIRAPHIIFTRLTLISPGGLPVPEPPLFELDPAKPPLLPLRCDRFARELEGSVLQSYVRVMRDKMTSIDREEKCVGLGDRSTVPYDTLVLCVGLESRPMSLAADIAGVVCIGSGDCEAQIAEAVAAKKQIVVYGMSLESLTAVAHIKAAGAASFTYVRPLQSTSTSLVSIIDSEQVMGRVNKALSEIAGLKVPVHHLHPDSAHSSLHLCQVINDRDLMRVNVDASGNVASAVFRGITGEETIPCSLLLVSSHHKAVDPDAFAAINASCLVFDGRLVVDQTFRTNDPAIFCGGPLSKYSRSVRDQTAMSEWSSREAGVELAHSVLRAIPYAAAACDLRSPRLTPRGTIRFSSTLSAGGILPGGLYYFRLRIPGPLVAKGEPSALLLTDVKDGPFLCLHTNCYGQVNGITYVGKEAPESDNYTALIGVQHHALNSAAERLKEGAVPDLVAFLREPWAIAVFHDRFAAFIRDFAEEVTPALGSFAATEIEKRVREGKLAEVSGMLDATARHVINSRIASFLVAHSSQLDQYALPINSM